MMHEVLLIKTEADNAAMLKQACKPYVQKIDLILCTDSLPQAVRLCQQHVPALIFLDTAELSASETNSCSAQFHDLCPDAFLFLISAPAGATQTLKTCVEMTILTPIDSDALRKSIGRCIRKAEAQKLLSEMEQKLSQLRPQIITALIRDIAVNASPSAIREKLDALDIPFRSGFIAAVQADLAITKKTALQTLFTECSYTVLAGDFFSYCFFLALGKPGDIAVMRSRTQEAAICAGIGSFQEELHGLHDSYEEALKDLLSATHTVIDRNQPSALKQTIMHNLN